MENLGELNLEYPLEWEYKIILAKEHSAKEAAKEVLVKKEHTIKKSQNSKSGKYTSHTVKLIVQSEKERKEIFEKLKQHEKIKFIL